MIFGDKINYSKIMNVSESANRPGVNPDHFPFSALHFIRTYNRLLSPAEIAQCYNLSGSGGYQSPLAPLPPLETIMPGHKIAVPFHSPTESTTSSNVSVISSKKHSDYGTTPMILNSPDAIPGKSFLCNSSMVRRQRGEKRPIPEEQKDEKYFERRKRNNEAAKKSRDARKMREDRIALRAALLEQENSILRAQTIALREEVCTLRQILCNNRAAAQL